MELLKVDTTTDSYFYETDSRGLYHRNLRKMPQDWVWRDWPVRYTVNSQGYRSPEFNTIDWRSSMLIFGCSFVFGLGISDTDTCAHQLSTITDNAVVNLGVSSSSPIVPWINSTILRYNNVLPKAVVYVWPASHRLTELKSGRKIAHLGPGHGFDKTLGSRLGDAWMCHPTQGIELLRYIKQNTSVLWNCPVLHYTLDHYISNNIEDIKILNHINGDFARDWDGKIAHPGIQSNKNWAETMSQDLNGLW